MSEQPLPYADDPRPGWRVRLAWPDGTTHEDAIRGDDRQDAQERARWNWPDAEVEVLGPDEAPEEPEQATVAPSPAVSRLAVAEEAGTTWRCTACATYVADDQDVCPVCEHDRDGRDRHGQDDEEDETAAPADGEDAAEKERRTVDLAAAAASAAEADLERSGTRNSGMVQLSSGLLAIIAAAAGLSAGDGTYPPTARAAIGLAAVLLAVVIAVLVWAWWPRHHGTGGTPHHARHSPESLVAELAGADAQLWHAERACVAAAIAVRRHRLQRWASAALAVVGGLLAAATVATLLA